MLWRETIAHVLHGPPAVTLNHHHFHWHLKLQNPFQTQGSVCLTEGWKGESICKTELHSETPRRLTFSPGFFEGIFTDWQEVTEEFGHTPRAWHLICHMALFSRP